MICVKITLPSRNPAPCAVEESMSRFTRWINKATSPEGCTAVDARQLRKFNHDLAIEADRHKQELEALLNAQLEYGDGASMNHPRLTRAILRAKKYLGE